MAIRQWFTFEHDPVARDVSPNQCALAANARRRHHVNALKLCGPVGDADRAVVAPCSVRPPPLTTHRHLQWAVVSMTRRPRDRSWFWQDLWPPEEAGMIGFQTLRPLGADKDEAHGRGHNEVRMRVATDENEPAAAIGYGEIDRFPAISSNKRQGDMKELAERLVRY
jgi:hypothetical protein